jgi:hypothetical protein
MKGRHGAPAFRFATIISCKANALSGLGLRYRALHSDRRFSIRTCDKPRLALRYGLLNGPSFPESEPRRYPQHGRLRQRRRDGDRSDWRCPCSSRTSPTLPKPLWRPRVDQVPSGEKTKIRAASL